MANAKGGVLGQPIAIVFPLLFVFGALVQRFILQRLQNVVLAATGGVAFSIRTSLSGMATAAGPVQVSVPRVIRAPGRGAARGPAQHDDGQGGAGRGVGPPGGRADGDQRRATCMLTFGVGAGLAGMAGALLALNAMLSSQIGGNFILTAFAAVVLAGLVSLYAGDNSA